VRITSAESKAEGRPAEKLNPAVAQATRQETNHGTINVLVSAPRTPFPDWRRATNLNGK